MTDVSKNLQRMRDIAQSAKEIAAPQASQPIGQPSDPMDWKLPCDVTVGHGTIRKGCSLRTLVTRMEVLYRMAHPNSQPVSSAGMTDFTHWLNDKRDCDVSYVFHDIVAKVQGLLSASGQAGRSEVVEPTDLNSIERYRLQMAAISTAAIGYWKEGDSIHPDYDTPALRDVARLYAKYAEISSAKALASEPVPHIMKESPYPHITGRTDRDVLKMCAEFLQDMHIANIEWTISASVWLLNEVQHALSSTPAQQTEAPVNVPSTASLKVAEKAVHQVIETYAESYAQMSRDGDGKINAYSVAQDLRANISHQIVQALAAAPVPAQTEAPVNVPSGWKLVPHEPTAEMRNEGADMMWDRKGTSVDVWQAMWHAAPAPVQTEAHSGRITGVEFTGDRYFVTVEIKGDLPRELRTINACAAITKEKAK